MDESTNRYWGYVAAGLADRLAAVDGRIGALQTADSGRCDLPSGQSVLGDGLLERTRSTSLALLGPTAAIGLAMVALALNQGWPLIAGAPIPGFGSGHQAVGDATVAARRKGSGRPDSRRVPARWPGRTQRPPRAGRDGPGRSALGRIARSPCCRAGCVPSDVGERHRRPGRRSGPRSSRGRATPRRRDSGTSPRSGTGFQPRPCLPGTCGAWHSRIPGPSPDAADRRQRRRTGPWPPSGQGRRSRPRPRGGRRQFGYPGTERKPGGVTSPQRSSSAGSQCPRIRKRPVACPVGSRGRPRLRSRPRSLIDSGRFRVAI